MRYDQKIIQHDPNNRNSLSTTPQIYRFQQMQRLQPNLMTDGIRNFIHTKHNKDNKKLRIFSFVSQRQRIQPKYISDGIRNFMHTKHNGENLNLKIFLVIPQRQLLTV